MTAALIRRQELVPARGLLIQVSLCGESPDGESDSMAPDRFPGSCSCAEPEHLQMETAHLK